jgi:hypothetical protein
LDQPSQQATDKDQAKSYSSEPPPSACHTDAAIAHGGLLLGFFIYFVFLSFHDDMKIHSRATAFPQSDFPGASRTQLYGIDPAIRRHQFFEGSQLLPAILNAAFERRQ